MHFQPTTASPLRFSVFWELQKFPSAILKTHWGLIAYIWLPCLSLSRDNFLVYTAERICASASPVRKSMLMNSRSRPIVLSDTQIFPGSRSFAQFIWSASQKPFFEQAYPCNIISRLEILRLSYE